MQKEYKDMRLVTVQRVAEMIGITSSAVHRQIRENYPSAKIGSKVDIWHGSDSEGEDVPTPEGISFSTYLMDRGIDPWGALKTATNRRDPQAVLGVSQAQTKSNKLKQKRTMSLLRE